MLPSLRASLPIVLLPDFLHGVGKDPAVFLRLFQCAGLCQR